MVFVFEIFSCEKDNYNIIVKYYYKSEYRVRIYRRWKFNRSD